MNKKRNSDRNDQMFVAYMSGMGVDELATKYKLEVMTVRQIICSVRLRHAVSPHRTYDDIHRASSSK